MDKTPNMSHEDAEKKVYAQMRTVYRRLMARNYMQFVLWSDGIKRNKINMLIRRTAKRLRDEDEFEHEELRLLTEVFVLPGFT